MGPPKHKWTAEEEAAIKAGIAKYGAGKWSIILKDPEFSTILHLRSNVDLKDKWRNIHVMTSGVGSRQRSRPGVKNVQPTTKHVAISVTLSTVVDSDVKIADPKPLEITSETLSTGGPKKPISRLDDHILEAITNLKEPCGSKRTAIAKQIEEQYLAPPNFERLLAANLKLLTDNGKLIKVNHQYRIALSSPLHDVKDPSPLLLDGRKDFPGAETNGSKVLTSSLLLDEKKDPPRAETNGNKVLTSSLLLERKKDPPRVEKNGYKVLTKADIDAELEKMRSMTPQEAAAAAAHAVKEAEAAIAEAEEAAREAEDAEREAEAAQKYAEAAKRAMKCRTLCT